MKNRTTAVIISCLFVLIVLLFGLLNKFNGSDSSSGNGLRYNPDTPETWEENIEAQKPNGIKIPGFSKIYFESGTKEVQLTLANPSANTCYFIYDLFLDDPEGENLYTSCRIDPGMALTDITLNRSLEAGEYTLYIKVNTYDIDSDTPLNAALLKTPLTVTQ